MFVAERFISYVIKNHGKHPVSTDGGTWYPQACAFLKIDHHVHSPLEKRLIERYSMSKTEPKVSMTTFLVESKNAN